ncbi:ATP-binding protein [Megalodesulfovibrio paquesii]
MYSRFLSAAIQEAMADTPVVHLRGARQVGKTTLARQFETETRPYLTLDNAAMLDAARRDPSGFVAGLTQGASGGAIIDEVQKAPALLPAIKEAVDRERRPGAWLLTGSADIMAVREVSESLAGRMETLTLWPLSWGELQGRQDSFLDDVFDPAWQPAAAPARIPGEEPDLVSRLLMGGYPEAVARPTPKRRGAWFESTLTAILERDVRELAAIQDLTALPRLLRLAAARNAGLCNHAAMAADLGMPQTTFKRYLALLEATFLLWELPAWSANLGQREVKAGKLMVADSGLAAHLLGLTPERLDQDRKLLGSLLEAAVAGELARQTQWSEGRVRLWHWRTHAGREVDIVLEDAAGRLVGLEVKASATVTTRDAAGLKVLAAAAPDRFVRGLVLHLGRESVPLAANLHAVPAALIAGRAVRQ